MKYLIYFELKKLFNLKKIIILSFITVVFLGIMFIFSLKTTDIYTNNNGILNIVQAIQNKRNEMNKYTSDLTDEELQKSVNIFHNIVRDDKNIDVNGNLAIRSKKQIKNFNANSDLAYLAIRAYSPLYTFDPSVLDWINLDSIRVEDIQNNRILRLKEINPNYQEDAKEDFTFESGYSLGWQSLLNDLPYVQIFIMIICAVFSM